MKYSELVQCGMKLCFCAVIMQLLYISLCASGDIAGAWSAVPEMLEYAAASCAVTVAGAYILEYFFATESRG